MLRRVQKYIRDHAMLEDGERVIVGVSGGADSMALLDILLRSGYECIIAHCNFHLRGEESNRDERFVKDEAVRLAARLPHQPAWLKDGMKVYTRNFDTKAYARETQQSIEMAARELRYSWFAELAKETGSRSVAVAHHMNDQAETILMHMRRGCGLKGMCGMWPVTYLKFSVERLELNDVERLELSEVESLALNDVESLELKVVRPFLCTTHDYICHYLKDIRGIAWVEDSTNSDTTIKRNAIREELKSYTKAEIEHIAQLAERMQEIQLKIDN